MSNEVDAHNLGPSAMDSLPNEIIHIIFKMVAADIPALYNTHASEYSFQKDQLRQKAAEAKESLRKLCEVSDRFDAVARPCLYETVIVSSIRALLRLFRALTENEELGRRIKRVEYNIPLDSDSDFLSEYGVSLDIPGSSEAPLAQQVSQDWMQAAVTRWGAIPHEYYGYKLPSFFCRFVLDLTPRLEDLSINMAWPYALSLDSSDPPHRIMLQRISPPLSNPDLRGSFLRKLTTLRLMCTTDGGPLSGLISFPFFTCPSLSKIVITRDDGNWLSQGPHPLDGTYTPWKQNTPTQDTEGFRSIQTPGKYAEDNY